MRTIIPIFMILIGSLATANADYCRSGYSYSAKPSYNSQRYIAPPVYYTTKRVISGYNRYGQAIYKTIRVPRKTYSSYNSGRNYSSSYTSNRGNSSRRYARR